MQIRTTRRASVRDWYRMKLTTFVIALALVLLAGGAVFLASWDIPAPSVEVEKTIPNDRFKR